MEWLIDVIMWLVVYPLMLFAALLIYKHFYHKYKEYERWQDHLEAVKRCEEEHRKIVESYHLNSSE